MSDHDLAVVHKHYPERGGAEVVADELGRTFEAPVYTGIANDGTTSDDVDVRELFGDSILAPFIRKCSMPWQAIRDAYYLFAWDYCPELAEYDVLVQSGMAPFWYTPGDRQTVVRYVHSTPRMPYDRYQDVGESRFVRAYSRVVRQLFEQTISYGDQFVANSELVARRLTKYFGVPESEIEVVYPPVDIDGLEPRPSTGEYYLALSRLDPAKRTDQIIDAFSRQPEKQLLIAGDGEDRERLRRLTHGLDNVRMLGYVDEDRKRRLLQNAKALVYAAENEDFGMVPVEALAAGTPVIGVEDGFTADQVEDGWSGITFERGVDELAAAIERFDAEGVAASPEDLAAVAQQCHPDRFRRQMREIVDQTVRRTDVGAETWGALAQVGERPHRRVPSGVIGGEDRE